MMAWRDFAFNMYYGPTIEPGEVKAIQKMALNAILTSFFSGE
jgi:hypothetical protein